MIVWMSLKERRITNKRDVAKLNCGKITKGALFLLFLMFRFEIEYISGYKFLLLIYVCWIQISDSLICSRINKHDCLLLSAQVCDFGLSRLKHHTFLSSNSTAGTVMLLLSFLHVFECDV